MSLVGGADTVRGTSDMTDVLLEVARNGPEFAARMDAYTKLRDEANAAVALVGLAQEIAPMHALAATKLKEADSIMENAKGEAASMVEAARKEVDRMKAEQRLLNDNVMSEVAVARQERDAAVAESDKIKREAAVIMEEARANSNRISVEIKELLKAADQEHAKALQVRAEAEALFAEAAAKRDKINAILRG